LIFSLFRNKRIIEQEHGHFLFKADPCTKLPEQMKRTTLKLPFLILCVTAGLQIMAGCKTDDGAFEWKEKRGKHTLYSRKDKIGHLEPLFLKDISTNDEITRIEDGVFRIKRTCKNISQRDFGQVRLTLDFVHEDSASFLMIPSVSYNGNRWGRGKEPKGYSKDGEWWSFSCTRTSIPGATYSEGRKWAVAMWGEPGNGEIPFSCALMPTHAETGHRLIWPEEEMPQCYINRDTYGPGFRKDLSIPSGQTVVLEAILIVTPVMPQHQAIRYFQEKAWKMIPHPQIEVRSPDEIWDLAIRFIHENLWAEEGIYRGFSVGLWLRDGGWIQRPEWKYEIGWAGQSISVSASLLTDYLRNKNKLSLERGLACLDTWAQYGPLPNGLIRNHFDYILGVEKGADMLDACNLGDAATDYLIAWQQAKECGLTRDNYKAVALNICDFMVKDQQQSGQYGKGWDTDGNCLYRDGSIGAYIIPAMISAYQVTGNDAYLKSGKRAYDFYFNDFAENGFTSAGALDTWCIDKESSWAILRSALLFHDITRDQAYLDQAEQISWYLSTWLWHYSEPVVDSSDFRKYGYDTFGATAVSTQHHHLDPGGLVLVPEWFKLAELTGHQIWKEKAKAVWANANQAVADGKTKFHDVVRPAGSQTEAYFQTYWVGKPGQINDWLVLWPSAARLEVLRMINPKVFSE